MKISTALIIQSFRRTLLLKQKDLDYFSSLYCLFYSFFFFADFHLSAIKAFIFINLKQNQLFLFAFVNLYSINWNKYKHKQKC